MNCSPNQAQTAQESPPPYATEESYPHVEDAPELQVNTSTRHLCFCPALPKAQLSFNA